MGKASRTKKKKREGNTGGVDNSDGDNVSMWNGGGREEDRGMKNGIIVTVVGGLILAVITWGISYLWTQYRSPDSASAASQPPSPSARPQVSVKGGDEAAFKRNWVENADATIEAEKKADVTDNVFLGADQETSETKEAPLVKGAGIKINNSDNVTIHGFEVSGFEKPIESEGNDGISINNNVLGSARSTEKLDDR